MPFPDKTQRPVGAGGDANTGRDTDFKLWRLTPAAYGEVAAIQPAAILRACNSQSFGQFARPIRQPSRRSSPATPLMHGGQTTQRNQGADQHASWTTFPVGDNIQTLVNAIDEVHVGPARRSEENLSPFRSPAGGMRCKVIQAQISFSFDNHACHTLMNKNAGQQTAGQDGRGLSEKTKRKRFGLPTKLAKGEDVARAWKKIQFVRPGQGTLEH